MPSVETSIAFGACSVKHAAPWAVQALAVAAWLAGLPLGVDLPGECVWKRGDASPVWREIRTVGIWITIGGGFLLALRAELQLCARKPARLEHGRGGECDTAAACADHGAHDRRDRNADSPVGRLGVAFLVMLCRDVAYCVVLGPCREWLTAVVLHKMIADRDRLLLL